MKTCKHVEFVIADKSNEKAAQKCIPHTLILKKQCYFNETFTYITGHNKG